MITPLQIDPYTRDLWQEYDALAIAQIAPLAYDDCYAPRLYVGLDTIAQQIPSLQNGGYSTYGLHIQPGCLIFGIYVQSIYETSAQFSIQVTDLNIGLPKWSDPISAAFLEQPKPGNYPALYRHPHPVVGKGSFRVEVWNQQSAAQMVVPVFGVLEPKG